MKKSENEEVTKFLEEVKMIGDEKSETFIYLRQVILDGCPNPDCKRA